MTAVAQLNSALAGRYDVQREIGRGGMATVYLARDVRHDRHVALKVLNPELGAVLGVDRFLAEIKVTANLQHPNLLPLFDSGEANGLLFYVMPFVEGESLRARLEREKQLPVDEAIRIAVAIGSALEYAHTHGVIHRDLKPENILLQAGQPVIADFGIALAVSKAGGARVTQTGLSLGTPQYMSPEQATGDRAIDSRTDIYSLGAMTYEMLAGEPPHSGTTAQSIIAKLLTDKPRSLRLGRESVPPHVEWAVERALAKLPADRFAHARDFVEALQGRGAVVPMTTGGSVSVTSAPVAAVVPPRRSVVTIALAAGVIALSAVVAVLLARPRADDPAPVRFIIALPDSARPVAGVPWPAAISPDGRTVVYFVHRRGGGTPFDLYALRTDQLGARAIPGAGGGTQPFFSPDGMWLAFEAGGKLKKVRLDGSAPVIISDGTSNNGGDWTTRDEIILGSETPKRGLALVSAAGGQLTDVTVADTARGESDHLWPVAFPDGKTIAFAIYRGGLAASRIALVSLDDRKVVHLDLKGIRPLAAVGDELIYVQADGAVMAVRVDTRSMRTVTTPVPVLDPVSVWAGNNGNSEVFVSRGGMLVQSRGGQSGRITWRERAGVSRAVSSDAREFSQPRLSPNGRQLAVTAVDNGRSDIWIHDLATSTFSRLTTSGDAIGAEWTPDGSHVVFIAATKEGRTGIWKQRIDGSAPAALVFVPPQEPGNVAVSPDGHALLYTAFSDNSYKIFRTSLDSGRTTTPWVASPAMSIAERFSPDGRWVAVVTNESGQYEVYVRSFPDLGAKVQVSLAGGDAPVWSPDGRRLFYTAGPRLIAATVTGAPSFRVLSRDTVFKDFVGGGFAVAADYDVARDGSRVLTIERSANDYQLVVVVNWVTEMRQRLAGRSSR